MKLSKLMRAPAQEELEEPLPYPCSELADPPITIAEARAVDLSRDTTLCRWHRGQLTHLNTDGKVYFCPNRADVLALHQAAERVSQATAVSEG